MIEEKIRNGKVKEKNDIKNQEKQDDFRISFFRLLAYFIIYSIVGYIIETIFGVVTKGVLESRKSFLYGPFCSIYGVGAVIMIISLQHFKKNKYTLFAGGFLVGSIVEYIISLIGEFIFHVKWWDYSNEPFNLNGRICITFSFFWGILAIYLITHFNPKVDEFIDKLKDKISIKLLKISTIFIVIFMALDCIITGYALKVFFTNLIYDYNLDVKDAQVYLQDYEKNNNDNVKKLKNKYFSNEKILKTFPNLKLTLKDGEIIFIKDLLSDIKPYYIKFFDKK